MIRANWSAQAINDTVQLLDNVTSGRQRLHTVTIFPEGGNLTLDFEIYDTGGRMQWGTNVVNITYVLASQGFWILSSLRSLKHNFTENCVPNFYYYL